MFRKIVISKESLFPGEAEFINQLMELGDFNFHLRKKETDDKELRKLIYKIAPVYYSRIVIHQHYEMEKEFSFKGIHLPENRRGDYAALKKEGHTIISTSIHELNQFEPNKRDYSYIFFAPVFSSISKPGHEPKLSSEKFSEEIKLVKNKSSLIALGGINAENLKDVKAFGFGGAAFLGSVWEHKSPVKYFEGILNQEN